MTDTPARKDIRIALAHSKTSEEKEAVEKLARALRESGESVGAQMRVNDSVDAQSIFGDKALHPGPEVARKAHQARQAPLQTPQQDRDYVRAPERLATRGNPL